MLKVELKKYKYVNRQNSSNGQKLSCFADVYARSFEPDVAKGSFTNCVDKILAPF